MAAGLKDYMVGILIFSIAATAFYTFSSQMFSFYNVEVGEEYEGVYSEIANITDSEYARADEMKELTQKGEANRDFKDFLSMITGPIITAVKLPYDTMKGIFITVTIVSEKMKIPTFIINGIMAIIMVSLSVLILMIFFGRRTR